MRFLIRTGATKTSRNRSGLEVDAMWVFPAHEIGMDEPSPNVMDEKCEGVHIDNILFDEDI